MSYSHASEKFSRKSLQLVQQIKCTCLRTLEASIDTITIFTKRSGNGSILCTDTIAGDSVSVVSAEGLQAGIVTHFRCHRALHLKSSLTTSFSVQKIKYTC